jgi:RNAse (barnase) inhibitor barstar
MSKKYVIDLPDDAQYILINGASENHCYTRVEQVDDLEELNSDYINEHFGELQDEAYRRGLNDMWDVVRKISLMTSAEAEEVFAGAGSYNRYNLGYSGVEAMDAYKAYLEKKDRIEVGDIVDRYIDGKFDSRGIYLGGNGEIWDCLFWANTLPITLAYPKEQFKKTGKHYDIASILEAMRE